MNSITLDNTGGKTYHLGGPEIWHLNRIIEVIREWTYMPSRAPQIVSLPLSVGRMLGRLRGYHVIPRMKRFYDEDWFVRQQYDIVVPTALETHTFKDLLVNENELTPLFPELVDICRPRFRVGAPTRFGVELQKTWGD